MAGKSEAEVEKRTQGTARSTSCGVCEVLLNLRGRWNVQCSDGCIRNKRLEMKVSVNISFIFDRSKLQ